MQMIQVLVPLGFIILAIAILMSMVGKGGGIFALKSKPKKLKNIFALTNLAAGLTMIISMIIQG
jgi:hypothetical protein